MLDSSPKGKRYFYFKDKKDAVRGLGLIAVVYSVVMFTALRPLHEWVFTQWMLSYELQFIKRALHGEILRLLGLEVSYILLCLLAMGLLLVLNVALILLFSRPVRRESMSAVDIKQQLWASNWVGKPINIGLGLFCLMALLHSATIQRFFQFPGYLEHLQLVLVLGAMVVLERGFRRNEKSSDVYSFLIVSGLCFIALFIHEGFLFFYMPMIFMYWTYHVPGSIALNIFRFILLAALVLQTWLIGTFGLLPADQFEPLLAGLQNRFGADKVDVESVRVWFRGFSSNLNFTWHWFEQRFVEKLIHLVFTIIILSPTAYVFWKLYEDDFRHGWRVLSKKDDVQSLSSPKNSALRTLLFLSCLTPMILVPIGIDLFRWISISILNLFVISFFLMEEEDFRMRVAETLFDIRYMVMLVIALSLIFGVLGITNSFSWVYKLTMNLGFEV